MLRHLLPPGASDTEAFANDGDTLVMGTFARMGDDLAAGRLFVVPLAVPAPVGEYEYGFIRARHRTPSRSAPTFMQAVRDEERACAEQEARAVALYGIRRAL